MVTCTINIPPMLAYIPAPWILWVLYHFLSCSIIFYRVLSCCNCCNTCMFRHQNPFFARLSFRSTSSLRPSPLRSLSFPLYQNGLKFSKLCAKGRSCRAAPVVPSAWTGWLPECGSWPCRRPWRPQHRTPPDTGEAATQNSGWATARTSPADMLYPNGWHSIIVIMLDQILNHPKGSMVLLLY